MGFRSKRSLVPFALAAVLALAALRVWLMALDDASLALVQCSSFWVFADAAICRWPAIYVGIGWILFTGALTSGWIGGVKRLTSDRLRASAGAQRQAGEQAAAFSRQQLERAAMSAGHALDDRQPQS